MPKATWSLLAGLSLSVVFVATALAGNELPTAATPAPLTLPQALHRVLTDHPALAAAQAEIAAAEASARQVGSLANPQLALDVENFAGSDSLRGFDGAESTLRLEQPLELGNRRHKRQAVATADQTMAQHQQELTRAELYARTVAVFTTQLAAQQRLQLADAQLRLATQTTAGIDAQIEAGKVPSLAAVRSRPLLSAARLERQRAEAALVAARAELAALLGLDDAAAPVAVGDLATLPQLADTPAPDTTPQLALARTTRERAAQELALARAEALPELTVGVGVRRFADSGETALVAGLSLPLPLFDRNRHAIVAADQRLEAARQQERNTTRQFAVAVAAARREFLTARAGAVALQEELVPAASETFSAIDFGYRNGKFGLFELLDAQQQLNSVQIELLTAQVDCHVAAARYDALLGRFPLASAGDHP